MVDCVARSKVGEYIETYFGISLHPSTAWKYLRRLGFSLQVPRPVHHQSATPQQRPEFQAGLAGHVAWLRFPSESWNESLFPHQDIEIWAEVKLD